MKKYTIHVTVLLENSFWAAIFERNDEEGFAVARHIFGSEPTDPELYHFVSTNFYELKFTEPNDNIQLVIKRMNFKRASREARKVMRKLTDTKKESRAQEVLRLDLEKNKKIKKSISKQEKELAQEERFQLRQEKKKKKKRGH